MKSFRLIAAATVTVAAVLIMVGPAAASPQPVVTATGDYCVIYLPTGAHGCVDNPQNLGLARAAIGINAIGKNGPAAADGTLSTWHIGTAYDNADYNTGRGYYEFFTSADCTPSKTDGNWQNQDLSNIGWQNRISSFHSYGNCQTRLFSTTNFGGSAYPANGYIANSSNVGVAMNDHANSIKWT